MKSKNNSDETVIKSHDHIRVVSIQIYAEYGKEKQRKVVHSHTFSEKELKELMAHTGNIGDYFNHMTKILRYEC